MLFKPDSEPPTPVFALASFCITKEIVVKKCNSDVSNRRPFPIAGTQNGRINAAGPGIASEGRALSHNPE